MTNINYIFVRHGHGCHNGMNALYNEKKISRVELSEYNTPKFYDPELTSIGVAASLHNGAIISKILKKIDQINLSSINVVGCSPLIRSMETAFFMTRKWKNPPSKIYVFPLLRELDEHSYDKYSSASIEKMNTTSSYAMKSIKEQKEYLEKAGLIDYFDFTFVEKFYNERNQPGDIDKFIIWFVKEFVSLLKETPLLNIFVVTHAGVLRDYSNEGFVNNSGFVLKTIQNENTIKKTEYISLNEHLPVEFFTDYDSSYFTQKTSCSDRCTHLCNF